MCWGAVYLEGTSLHALSFSHPISLLNLPCMQVVIDWFEAIFFSLVGWFLACAYMCKSGNFAVKIILRSRPTVKI